jgi:hypothetical protein
LAELKTELTPTDTSVATVITNDLSWVKHHLILAAFVVVIAFFGVYAVESLISSHDSKNDAKWQAILAAQTAQFTEENKKRDAENAASRAEILQIAQSIASRNTQVAQQVKTDATLSAQEAAQRLAQQTKAQPGEVVAQGNNLLVDLPISRGIVTSLDLLPAAQANLTDTQKQLAAQTQISTNLQSDVSGLRTLNQDQQKACTAQVAAVKAQARKSKTKIGAIFLGIGIVVARLAGI